MSKLLNNVIIGSSLDLELTFHRFGQDVLPQAASWKLVAQKEDDPSTWVTVSSHELTEEELQSSTLQVTISGNDLTLISGCNLNRMVILDWTYNQEPYKDVLTFSLQTLPTIEE